MPNKIYYKIPHEIASEPTHSWQKGPYGYKQRPDWKRGIDGDFRTRKTKLSKHEAIERDLKTSGIPYLVETTDTHVIIHN